MPCMASSAKTLCLAQLWENEGLDLKLIPYGCLATSTNTGFIEVVKNAKTISEVSQPCIYTSARGMQIWLPMLSRLMTHMQVSGISENQKKRLYEWIESYQLKLVIALLPYSHTSGNRCMIHRIHGR